MCCASSRLSWFRKHSAAREAKLSTTQLFSASCHIFQRLLGSWRLAIFFGKKKLNPSLQSFPASNNRHEEGKRQNRSYFRRFDGVYRGLFGAHAEPSPRQPWS